MNGFLKGRQAVYEFLYRAFYKVPDEAFYDLILKFEEPFLLLNKDFDNEDLKTGTELLRVFIADKKNSETVSTLNSSFTKLFLMGNKSVEIKESGWRVNELAKSDIVLSLSTCFADDGIVKPSVINMPIDAYSMELYYLFRMAERAANSREGERADIFARQLAFMESHIMKWNDLFKEAVLKKCEEESLSCFYKSIMYLCSGYLEFDREFIKELMY